EKRILDADPFQTLDREGVGTLVRMAVEKGRAVRAGLKIGICGEHGGDPASVRFCHEIGLEYVSCSPFRVPIARLAAAQAALAEKAAIALAGQSHPAAEDAGKERGDESGPSRPTLPTEGTRE